MIFWWLSQFMVEKCREHGMSIYFYGILHGKPWIPNVFERTLFPFGFPMKEESWFSRCVALFSPGWSHRRRWTFLVWALRLGKARGGKKQGYESIGEWYVNDRWMTGEGDLKSDVCCYRLINDDQCVYIIYNIYIYIYIIHMYTSWNWTLFARLFWTRQRVLSHGFAGYVRVTTRVYVD